VWIHPADRGYEESILFQLVRRAAPTTPTERGHSAGQKSANRENFLATALITVLSVNIFMVSGVLSFCLFVFWYPS